MIFAIVKSEKEKRVLDEALKEAKDKAWYRRLMIIKLSSQGRLIRHLKKEFGVCEATIRNYIHSYNQGGLDGLRPKKPTGRPPKIAHWSRKDWDGILKKSPNQYEKLETNSDTWTLELMSKYLMEYKRIEVCVSSVYNSLHRTKVYKRPIMNSSTDFELPMQNAT